MRHILFQESAQYSIVLLMNVKAFNKSEIISNYLEPLKQKGISEAEVVAFTLEYDDKGKTPVKFMRAYLDKLMKALEHVGIKYIYVADAAYFKELTKSKKADPHFGYVLPCAMKGYEHMQVVLGLNHKSLFYKPDLKSRLTLSLNTLASVINGTYTEIGENIIKTALYPSTEQEISQTLTQLLDYPLLTADIEAFSLDFFTAGIGTIAFAWNEHEGAAFNCDYHDYKVSPVEGYYGYNGINLAIRTLLKQFFEQYTGKLIWHRSNYDLKVLIYTLWMDNPSDYRGLLKGLSVMTKCFGDTKIMAYLCLNSTARNSYSLKDLAHEFAGNWAKEDIKDIRLIPLEELLQYNLVDALSTYYIFNKYTKALKEENQEDIYNSLFIPSLKTIIQMELTGMPMDAYQVQKAKKTLNQEKNRCLDVVKNSNCIKTAMLLVWTSDMEKANAKLTIKQHPIEKFMDKEFNPNSNDHLIYLLYEVMGLPVLDKTPTKQPACGGDTLEKLVHHTENQEYRAVIQALVTYSKVQKILTSFIPAFENGAPKADGMNYLHGNFNLGSVVSGRMSASDPNLMQLPNSSVFGKLIKKCFQAQSGWLLVGADFNSLEDMINALLTKDTNKLKIYTDGYDSHSFRSKAYWPEKFPHIVDTVESINSIKKLNEDIRQDSKPVTFSLTFLGTWRTLVKNLGFSEEESKKIEANYHELYKESDEWMKNRITEASKVGYAEVAFGLKIRCPILYQTIRGKRSTPYEAEKEARTLGNAMGGQSYGQLNNRAANAFMQKVWDSKYAELIKPVCHIHDSQYYLIKDDIDVLDFVNRELIKEMQWQELPELKHDTVKLGSELSVFWPSWANELTIPNNATQEEIRQLCADHKEKMKCQKK